MNMKTDLPAELPAFFNELVNGPEAAVKPLEMNRRGFLKFTGIAGGGLVLGGMALTGSKNVFSCPCCAPRRICRVILQPALCDFAPRPPFLASRGAQRPR